jgi:hypothetical protein
VKSGLPLALAHTAYMRDLFNDVSFVETSGMTASTQTDIDRKKGMKRWIQKVPLISIATACAGLVGYAGINTDAPLSAGVVTAGERRPIGGTSTRSCRTQYDGAGQRRH